MSGFVGINARLVPVWQAAKQYEAQHGIGVVPENVVPEPVVQEDPKPMTEAEFQQLSDFFDTPLDPVKSVERFMQTPPSSMIALIACEGIYNGRGPGHKPIDVLKGTFQMRQGIEPAYRQPADVNVGGMPEQGDAIALSAMTTVKVLGQDERLRGQLERYSADPGAIPATVMITSASFWLQVEANPPGPESVEAQILADARSAHMALSLACVDSSTDPLGSGYAAVNLIIRSPRSSDDMSIASKGDIVVVSGEEFLYAVGARVD